jgi:hypothetical protein
MTTHYSMGTVDATLFAIIAVCAQSLRLSNNPLRVEEAGNYPSS